MSKLIVCTTKKASVPFTFLNTKVEIYTYEELCFYIYNNTVLISKSSLSEKLFDWIRNELEMPALADRLTGMVNKTSYAQELLVEILSAGNYYTSDEVKVYAEAWQKYKKLSPVQRLKLKADGYLGYRRYIKAANIYDDIIDMADEIDSFFVVAVTEDTETLRQEIRRQDIEDAEEYFEDIMMEIGDAKDDVREMTIFAMLQRAVYNKMNKDMNDYDKRMDIILSELKDNFREESI